MEQCCHSGCQSWMEEAGGTEERGEVAWWGVGGDTGGEKGMELRDGWGVSQRRVWDTIQGLRICMFIFKNQTLKE